MPKITSLFLLRFLKRKFSVFPSHSRIWQHCQAGGLLQLLLIRFIKILQSFPSDQFCLLSLILLFFTLSTKFLVLYLAFYPKSQQLLFQQIWVPMQMQSAMVMHLNNNSNRQKCKITQQPPYSGVRAGH